MKLRLPHLLRRLLIATMTVTGVTVGTSNSYGAIMNSDVPLSTYTDFGQNMGWYKTEADANALLTWIRKQQGGVTIAYTGGQETYTLEHEMINFTGVSDNGAFMSLGYNATTSVEHNGVFGGSFTSSYIGADNSVFYQGIEYRIDGSETFIHSPQGGWDKGGFDHKVTRMSKVITDVQTATLFSGTSAEMRTYVVGEQLYHTGAGTMKMYDTETGTINGLTGAYAYIVGGIETIDGAWAGGKDNDGDMIGDYDVISTAFNTEGHESVTTYEPLPYAGQQGDSGSPVFVYNSNTGQYEYVAAVQSIAGGYSTHYYGGIDYVRSKLSSYDKLVQSAAGYATLHIGAVTEQGDTLSADNVAYNYGMEATVSTTKWLGTVTVGVVTDDAVTDGAEDGSVSFVGVQSGINTWLDLSAVKDTDNWFNYDNTYLNAAPYATAGKQLTYADLFVTENLVFAAGTATTDIILDATVDLGIGYAQFSLGGTEESPITSATFNISSGGDGSYQFNHAGYVIDAGVDVHTTLTGSADHMYEWRKVGAGNLHIEGTGNNDILLNVGGAGKTYLNRTAAAGESSAYAAYNVLANTYATVVIADINQIARDFTFGHQGGVLDMNGNSMDWNNSNADVSAAGFTIHALDEQAIVANLKSGSTTTLTWTQSGAQTFLGSFADNGKDSALQFIYNGGEGASLALHSIKTSLTAPGSGMVVQSGTLSLSGTNTVHGTGSESGKNANRYHSDLDWHYADATSDVTVQDGGTFELGSHARLTGDITVEQGGTFLMREGVQHAQEYVEGSTKLMSTDDVSAFFGLKGNVSLASGATMRVEYGSGVTANNTYSGNITGRGNVEIDLGSADARFTLAGKNIFSGTKKLDEGLLIGDNVEALGYVGESGWLIGAAGTLQVASGLTADNALGLVDAASTGTLSLTEDMGALNMSLSGHTGLFIGAAEGQTIQYGTAEESISPAGGKYNLGGGGGELVVNAALTGGGNLVLGNGKGLGGIVTLTNASNSIGSITFNPGVTLSFDNTSALGGANITLVYGSSLLGSSDSAALLGLIQSGSQGAILLDRADNANFDMSNDGEVALSASGNVTYSGTVTVAEGGTYRFGGGSGSLTLTQALAANGSNGLVIDGQNSSGGKVILGAVSDITGQVTVQGYKMSLTAQPGDVTLGFAVDNALREVGQVTVARGGVLDVGSTKQTFTDIQVSTGGLLKGNSDGTLIFHMTKTGEDAFQQLGYMQLGKAEKTGSGELKLSKEGHYSWELLTIKEGTVFTQVDNALSATGITRVEGTGVLNMNTWNGEGFQGRTMHGNVELADGGTLSAGTGNDYAITFNGTISAAEGSTGTITNGSSWILNAAENNIGGGTLVFNAPRLELNQTIDQHIGGTLDIGANSVTLYSGGAGEDMLKHFSHVNIGSGKTLNLSDRTWNTIWQFDKLTGSGTINWDSTTTHDKTARVILSGDGGFSGTINMLRRYNQSNRTHQAFIEINGENAVSGATLNFAGTGASSYASLAINADNVNIGGLQSNVSLSDTVGTDWAHIFAGAAPELSASTTATASSRKATLTITGSEDYTYGGHVGSTADTKENSLNITMNGSGTQSFEGGTIVVGDLTAKSGTLRVQNLAGTHFQVLGDVNMYQGGTLTVSLGSSADEFGTYADFTLGSGHVLNVLDVAESTASANFYANLVLGGGSLNFDVAELVSGADYAMLNLEGKAVSYAANTSALTISLSNTSTLGVGTYYLADGDWSGISASSISVDGMPHMTGTFTATASGLWMELVKRADSRIWEATEQDNSWKTYGFGSSLEWTPVKGTAVFDDSAGYTTVNVAAAQDLENMIFNAFEKDYTLNAVDYGVTTDNLYQQGGSTTTLLGTVTVESKTVIENGELVVTSNTTQTLGTISGEGTLTVDWGQGDATASGTLNITDIGTLHVKSGVYTTGDNLEKFAADKVKVDAGATLAMGANTTMFSAVETAGTITTNSGELTGGVTLTGDATINVTANDTALKSDLSAADYTLTKSGAGNLQIADSDISVKQIDVQDGGLKIGVQVAEGLQSINMAGGKTLCFDWGGGVSNTEILLGAGSTLQVVNGGAGVIDAAVKLNGSYAFIQGGRYNGGCTVNGTISTDSDSTRTLTLINDEGHSWHLASAISGNIRLDTFREGKYDPSVTISGDNSFTGGVTLEYGTITTSHANALGTGQVVLGGYGTTSDGKLLLNKDLTISSLSSTIDYNDNVSRTGTLSLNKKTLTVGAYGAEDAEYAGIFNTALIGSLAKIGANTQTFSSASVKVDDVSVQGGTLALTHEDAQIVGNISIGTETDEGVLNMAGTYTLNQGNTLSVLSNKQSTLGGLTLNGGVMALLFDASATAETVALTVEGVVQDGSMTILLNGEMPAATGEYLLVGGNFANVSAGGVSVAVQEAAMQTFALARSGEEEAPNLFSSVRTTEKGLYLVLSESTDSNIWAGDADHNTWSADAFSVYGTSMVGEGATAIFNSSAANKNVNVAADVSVGGMQISGGGYSFSGEGSISLSGPLSVTDGGDASFIEQIYIPNGPIKVDGSELTIIELTPANPSAPIELSNAAKLTIGSDDYRYGAFSGNVTGDEGSQLHLYTTQVSGNYWQEDGRVHLLTDSSVQDVYIHGDLALNKFSNDGNQTNLQGANLHIGANLHMDADSQRVSNLVVRSSEATLTPTTGNIVLHGDLNLVTYSQVNAEGTNLTTDFTLAEDTTTGTLTKTDSGSITLSGNLAVFGVTVNAGALKLTGSNTQTMVYTVNSGATLTLAGDSDYSFDASSQRTISGTLNVEGTVNVSGTSNITIAPGGKLALGNGASFNRTQGNGGAYWIQGSLTTMQDATASFSSVDDVHFHNADNGSIDLLSGSTLNMNVKSLQYWRPATIDLAENATLNLTTTNGVVASSGSGNNTPDLDITLAAGATFDAQNSAVTLNGSSTLTVGSGATAKLKTATFNDGSIITLQGGRLELNLGTANATTAVSSLVVNNTAATAETPSTSVVYNGGSQESMGRTFNSVSIAANNTLELQQNNWNTIWTINSLSGEGNLTWKSTTTHSSSSRLIIAGDNDFSGNITLDRAVDNVWANGNWQAFLVLASDTAAKSATLTLTGADSADNAIMAVDTANAQVMGVSGNAYSHIYAGAAKTSVSGSDTAPASSASNTLTIAGAGGTFAGTVGADNESAHLNLAMTGSGTQTFSGVAHVGDVGVQAGTLALSHADSKVYGNISVSGGALDFDGTYTLGAGQSLSISTAMSEAASLAGLVLAGGEIIFDATALSADTAALSVGTLSLSEGTASQTITFANADELVSGRYMLAGSWTTPAGLSLASTGLNNGTATYTVENGALYMDYVSTLYYTWTGTTDGNWNYSAANWDTDAADADVAFVADKVAIFETDANVTVSEAVSASKLIVREGAQVSLSNLSGLTVSSIAVESGKLSITGSGTSATAYSVATGAELVFSGSADSAAASSALVNATGAGNLTLDGVDATWAYDNASDLTGKLTIRNATLTSDGFGGNVNDYKTKTTYDLSSFTSVELDGATVKFVGDNPTWQNVTVAAGGAEFSIRDMGTANSSAFIFSGTTTLEGTLKLSTTGWKSQINIASLTGSGDINVVGAGEYVRVKINSTSNYTGDIAVSGDLGRLILENDAATSYGSAGATVTLSGAASLWMNGIGALTLNSTLVVNESSSLVNAQLNSAAVTRTLDKVTIADSQTLTLRNTPSGTAGSNANPSVTWIFNDLSGAGHLVWESFSSNSKTNQLVLKGDGSDFTGNITVNRSFDTSHGPYQTYVVLASDDAAKNSLITLNCTAASNKQNAKTSLAVNTTNAQVKGLASDEYAHLYAGAPLANWGSTAAPSTANNTLTIAGGDTYAFAGTVGADNESAHLNLAMIGSGTQTFSGVAHVGDVSVSNGSLALSNASSVVYGNISVTDGSFTLGSSYTLGAGQVLSVLTGAEQAVTLGGIALAGGEMVFDASLLNADTAALTLTGAATVGEGGGATVTLDFSKLSGALATGNYLLAAGDWSGAAAENVFTYNGSGTATLSATSTGLVLNYTNDSVYTWVGGATDGEGAADSAWTSANWDLEADEDASNNASWVTGKDAIFNTNATVSVGDAVTAGTVSIQDGAQVTLNGSGSLTVENLVVANGKLTLGEQTNWTNITDITVKESGTLSLGWGTGLTATSLSLQGGTVELNNGSGTHHHLNAAIKVDGSGTINGSSTGNDTDIQGSITGAGVLNIGKTHEDRNPIKISSTMTDGDNGSLAVNIIDANVVYSGAKRYTGGTTIGATGSLTVNAGGQEGGMVGEIDVYGTLKLNAGDATGWGSSNNTVSAINVYEGGTFNVVSTANQTGSGIAINLQGGTMTGSSGSNFDLGYGGTTRGHSTISVLAAANATAENVTLSEINTVNITLRQYTTVFDVEEHAKLTITSNILPIDGKSHLNGEADADSTFTKTGLGELVLSGANTYTAATTVQAGTLTLANGGALNSAVTVNEGATFKLLADTAAVSYGKAISGAGTVVKAGANTATLSAANLNLAALDVQAGFVAATQGLTVGELSVAEGAGFVYDLSSTPAMVTANSYNDAITFRLDNIAGIGTYDVFQAASGMSAAQVTLTGTYDTNTYRTATSVSESGLVSIGVYYTGLVWNTAGATDAWNTTDANWNNAATATTYTDGSKVTFAGTGETVTIDGTVAPGDVIVRGTGYTLSGGTIASSGSLSVLSGASLTLTQSATFAGGVTVDGTLGYDVAAGQEIGFTGTIAGSGELHKTGEGTLNLGALNSSNISTTLHVSEGVLKFTGNSTEQPQDTPTFISVLSKLETSGTGKLLVEGDVVYNYQGNGETQRVITIDDAVEITGKWQINSWDTTGNNGYRKYLVADGADLTVGGTLWLTNKQEMVVQNGAVLHANGGIKLGHDSSGSGYTARFVVEGGEVKTSGITFRRDGNPRTGNAFIMTGGRVEFAPASAATNVIQKLNDGANGTGAIEKGEVSLTGGTLVAKDSSWLMDAGSAENFHVYGVTFETAADKSITLAGNINFTPAEGANGTITKTGEGMLVFNVADKTLAGLDIQGGWVQAQQAITLSTLTLADGAGFAYDLSATPKIVTAATYTGDLNFRLDNLAVGATYDIFQGSADGTWTNDNVTLSGYNVDMYDVTVSSNAGLVSISVAYAGLLWDTDFSDTNTWVAADGETSWNGGENTENVAYSGTAKAIFAGEGEEITISGTVTPDGLTVSGTGYAFVGTGSIGGDGKLTVANGADLTISTANTYTGGTVIEEGGMLTITKLQALGGSDGVLGKVSGAGTLVLNLDSGNTAFATGEGDAAVLGAFTGTVDITSGTLQVGSTSTDGTGAPADFGAEKVIVRNGATFTTSFGYGANNIHVDEGSRQFSSALDLMSGSTLNNVDGNIAYAGPIRFNVQDAAAGTFDSTGTVKIQQYWAKTLEFSGLLEGAGTVEMYSPSGGNEAIYKITGEDNTFAGTYKLLDGSWAGADKSAILVLGQQNAAANATIALAATTSQAVLQADTAVNIAGLSIGTNAKAKVTGSNVTAGSMTLGAGSTLTVDTATVKVTDGVTQSEGSRVLGTTSATATTTIIPTNGGVLDDRGSLYAVSGTLNIGDDDATTGGTVYVKGLALTGASKLDIKSGNTFVITGTTNTGSGTATTTGNNYGDFQITTNDNSSTKNTVIDVAGTLTANSRFSVAGGTGTFNVKSGGTVNMLDGTAEGGTSTAIIYNVEGGGRVNIASYESGRILDVDNNVTLKLSDGATVGGIADSTRGEDIYMLQMVEIGGTATIDTDAATYDADTFEVSETDNGTDMVFTREMRSKEDTEAVLKVAGHGTAHLANIATLSGGLEVEQGAALAVSSASVESAPTSSTYSDIATITSADGENAATVDGAVLISHTDGAASIEGKDENAAATVNNSLITIAQGASLTVDNMIISESSRINGQTAATFAARTAGVTNLTATNTTVMLGEGNAEVAGQAATLAQNTLVSLDGTATKVQMAGDFSTLAVTSNALSSLTLNAGSSLTIDFSSLLTDVQIANIDLIELSFADVNVDWTDNITITGVLGDNRMTAYYLAPAETAVANVGSIYFATDSIPEPTTTTLSILALAALAARRRRR